MKSPKHILVIRLSAMGDVAMTVPVLRQLIKTHPDLKITVLTKPFFKTLFNDISNVSVFGAQVNNEHKGLFGLFKLYKELKSLKVDAVADLHNVLRSKILRFFFTCSGVPSKNINKGRKEKKLLTQEKNKIFKPLRSTHQRYADVFRSLNLPIELEDQKRIRKNIPVELKERLFSQPTIGIAPFAAHTGKQYPLDSMTRLIEKLSKEQVNVLLFGGGHAEVEVIEKLSQAFNNVYPIAGQLDFETELAVISNLDVMLSMDSGNGHLAAIYSVPVVTLWGVTHPYAGFAPYGQPKEYWFVPDLKRYPKIPTSVYGNKVPPGYEDVMASISITDVIQKLLTVVFKKP